MTEEELAAIEAEHAKKVVLIKGLEGGRSAALGYPESMTILALAAEARSLRAELRKFSERSIAHIQQLHATEEELHRWHVRALRAEEALAARAALEEPK